MIQPVVSICIPTYGRVEILHKTIESIYGQNVDASLFEVCISDNSPTDETKEMLNVFFSDKGNITYSKSTCEGYYNSIEALKLGNGRLLKLHNNYTMFASGKLISFINSIQNYMEDFPVLFFSAGSLKSKNTTMKYNSFDSFLNAITYFSTWSTSFCIWKEDFTGLLARGIALDKMFPHTSLLFSLTDKAAYIVDDEKYFENQDVGKKGGYNLPETFGTRYLGMCRDLLTDKKIEEQTFQRIKSDILQFIADWYVNVTYFSDKYTFSFENWEKVVSDLYGSAGVNFIKRNAKKQKLQSLFRKVLKKY